MKELNLQLTLQELAMWVCCYAVLPTWSVIPLISLLARLQHGATKTVFLLD